MSKRTDFVGMCEFEALLWDDDWSSGFRPRPRRVSRQHYWPHIHGHMRLTWPRSQIGTDMTIITDDAPLPHAVASFGPDWPVVRARIIERLRAKNPDHPWVREEDT